MAQRFNRPYDEVRATDLAPDLASYGIALIEAEASNPSAIESATERLIANGSEVIYTGTSPLVYNLRRQLIDQTSRSRIPVVAYRSQLAEAGALFSYGASLPEQIRRSAAYVDKILRGARPSELPVEQATILELVVNLKTARALGIEIPRQVLLRADRILE